MIKPMKAFFKKLTRKYHRPDSWFIILLGFIVFLGLVFLTSASAVVGLNTFGSNTFFLVHQLLMGVLPGVILFVFLSYFDYRNLRKIALPFLIFSLILLGLVFVPGIGLSRGGSRRWIALFGLSFQPAELVKLTLIIYLAALFNARQKKIKTWTGGFVPLMVIFLVIAGFIVAQKDMGTLIIIFLITLAVYFLAGGRWLHLMILFGSAAVGFLLMIVSAPYRMQRFLTFFYPALDPLGIGYHVNQALIAIGSGGIFGVGLGHSLQRFLYLPEAYGDSIFAVMGEELGFLATTAVIILFIFLVMRGLKIVKAAPDFFGRLLASGILSWFVFQIMINLGAMLHLFPLTGVPLPLVSYGGSSMMVFLAAFGIVVNISRQSMD